MTTSDKLKLASIILGIPTTILVLDNLGAFAPSPPDADYIKSHVWEFRRTPGTVLSNNMVFGTQGDVELIGGYDNPNECKWKLDESDLLVFKKCDGTITTRFSRIEREYFLFGKYVLIGDTEGGGDTHELAELRPR